MRSALLIVLAVTYGLPASAADAGVVIESVEQRRVATEAINPETIPLVSCAAVKSDGTRADLSAYRGRRVRLRGLLEGARGAPVLCAETHRIPAGGSWPVEWEQAADNVARKLAKLRPAKPIPPRFEVVACVELTAEGPLVARFDPRCSTTPADARPALLCEELPRVRTAGKALVFAAEAAGKKQLPLCGGFATSAVRPVFGKPAPEAVRGLYACGTVAPEKKVLALEKACTRAEWLSRPAAKP